MNLDANLISAEKKRHILLALTENQFRDKIVFPLFTRMGLKWPREMHGHDEEGKDCIFLADGLLGNKEVYAFQTKKGNINKSRNLSDNLLTALTQISTALNTTVHLPDHHISSKPHKVVLCCSGIINQAARIHIATEINDPRLEFYDSETLIPLMDKHYPEYWFGVDSQRNPYLTALREYIISTADTIPLSELGIGSLPNAPVTDELFMPLTVHRFFGKLVKRKGKVSREAEIEELSITRLTEHSARLILLFGDAGDGKTTALKRMAFVVAEKSLQAVKAARIPVLLKCSRVAESNVSIVQLAGAHTAELAQSQVYAFTPEELEDGKVFFFIDALDEVTSEELRQKVIERICELHQLYPRCQIVLTSRPYQVIRNLVGIEKFTEFQISALEIKKARGLLQRIAEGRHLPSEAPQEMMRQLQLVHGFQLNPLLVTVFAATSDFNRRDIPANITELLKKFTELMLGRWDTSKGLGQQTQSNIKDFLLQNVALHMHRRNKTTISMIEFVTLVRECLDERGIGQNLDQFCYEMLTRSGLLRAEDSNIQFRHLLLQEFFAGRAVTSAEEFVAVLHDEWWRKPIIFYCGDRPQAFSELDELLKHLHKLDGEPLYNGAITLGLAIQACYLAKLSDKRDSVKWVLEALSRTYAPFSEQLREDDVKYPLYAFLDYYLRARDAVATPVVLELLDSHASQLPGTGIQDENGVYAEAFQFWRIVGLIESGELVAAKEQLKGFKPRDTRLLLALHMGCFLVANLRISTPAEKKVATEVCEILAPQVQVLRREVLEEFNTLLLEVRSGKITAIDEKEAD